MKGVTANMPRPRAVTRKMRLHAYNVKYIKGDELDAVYSGTFYLPKLYKTNYLVTLNLEKEYGIHVLAIVSHYETIVTGSLPIIDYIKNAEIISDEPILNEYENIKNFNNERKNYHGNN